MKKIIFMSVAIVLANVLFAQAANKTNDLQNVQHVFSAKYPNAISGKWKQNDSNYFVAFNDNNKKSIAYYSLDGKWKKTETKIKWIKNLPAAVQDEMGKKGFLAWTVMDMKKSETAESTLYVVHINDGNTLDSDHHDAFTQYFMLYFSESGELIKKVEVEN